MKNIKKSIITGAIVCVIAATSATAFAVNAYQNPAEAAADLTGKTVETVIAERTETGRTYGAIAAEAGKLEEFKAAVLEIKKEVLNERVENGNLTQEKADEIITKIEENQANCDGTGAAKIGQGCGIGMGNQNRRAGKGAHLNSGNRGNGMGQCLRDGSCTANQDIADTK